MRSEPAKKYAWLIPHDRDSCVRSFSGTSTRPGAGPFAALARFISPRHQSRRSQRLREQLLKRGAVAGEQKVLRHAVEHSRCVGAPCREAADMAVRLLVVAIDRGEFLRGDGVVPSQVDRACS